MKSDPKKLTLPCWMFSLLSKPYLTRDWLSHLIEAYRGMWGILFETIGNGCSMDMAMEFGEEVVARKGWWRLWCMADGIGQRRWRAFDDGSCVQWWRRHSMTARQRKGGGGREEDAAAGGSWRLLAGAVNGGQRQQQVAMATGGSSSGSGRGTWCSSGGRRLHGGDGRPGRRRKEQQQQASVRVTLALLYYQLNH